MRLPDQPWETTFNFVMVMLVTGAFLVVMWASLLGKGGEWWQWVLLGTITFQVVSFATPRIVNWVRHARR